MLNKAWYLNPFDRCCWWGSHTSI